MECKKVPEIESPTGCIPSAVTTLADFAANGIPIGKNARLVAKVEDQNHGDYKAKPAAVVGVSFEF